MNPRPFHLLLLATLLALTACAGPSLAAVGPAPTAAAPDVAEDLAESDLIPAQLSHQPTRDVVVLEGYLEPITPTLQVAFSPQVSGLLQQVHVRVGEQVEQGQLLATLDGRELEREMARARHSLEEAQVELDSVEQKLAQDTADARGALAIAGLELLRAQHVLTETRAAVAGAQAALARLQTPTSDARITALDIGVKKAEAARQRAQAAYDRVAGMPDVGLRPEALALQLATLDLEEAQALYEETLAGPAVAEVQMAQADLEEARSREAAQVALVDISRTRVQLAQHHVETLEQQSTPTLVYRVRRLQEELLAWEAQRQDLELRAPWAGMIVSVEAAPGTTVVSGTPVVMRLAAGEPLQFVSHNLSERYVSQVQVGRSATITLSALPGRELVGQLRAIVASSSPREGNGDATFTAYFDLVTTGDRSFSPGFTGIVELPAFP